MIKKIISFAAAGIMLVSAAGCSTNTASNVLNNETSAQIQTAKQPKYVFLFIGDGMSYPQFQATADYLGAKEDTDYDKAEPSIKREERNGAVLDGPKALNFMNFETVGTAVTYDSCSFAPDSASTATSIATGHKTYSGMINVDETGSTKYETIAEKLHKEKNWKIGVISSVNLNHATPAAFYAHQASRNNYYEIGEELVQSDFEYFAGGGFKDVTGKEKDKENLYDKAKAAGYTVVDTKAGAESVTANSDKVIIIDEKLADSDAMKYEIDRKSDELALSDYVKKGIEVLDNDNGFFMMCEGGKIDWACHANDAASTINDTVAFSNAVGEAITFAKQHPDETLIVVTGDHETGGLTIGFAGTDYDTYLTNLSNQKISFTQFDEEYIAKYKEQKTSFEEAMKDVEALFGLKMTGAENDRLVLTEYEKTMLKTAYDLAMTDFDSKSYNQEQYVLYGTYNPFSVEITRILNNKSGIDFTSFSHTGLPVGVFADGAGAENFTGYFDNTEIYNKLCKITGLN